MGTLNSLVGGRSSDFINYMHVLDQDHKPSRNSQVRLQSFLYACSYERWAIVITVDGNWELPQNWESSVMVL